MNKAIKVLHFSTHNEDCGIGKYQELFLDAMKDSADCKNDFFPVSPNQIRVMSTPEKEKVFSDLINKLSNYDILHVQHEFSFYPYDEFMRACKAAKTAGKKLVVTLHTSPDVAYQQSRFSGLAPRNIIHYMRSKKRELFFEKYFVAPLKIADGVIVHNRVTRHAIEARGVDGKRIKEITIPVPLIDHAYDSTAIAENLNRKPSDIIIATTGFLHKYKGVDEAIKALTFLPETYKLAIIGGMHQDHDHAIYNDIADLIRELNLKDRVYITGYIKDDIVLNALIREVDVCVYPYERNYYSNVSSAALNNAFANHKPVIAYPTESFKQINGEADCMQLTGAFSYYELAREVRNLNIPNATRRAIKFSKEYSYKQVSLILNDYYRSL